MDWVKNGLLLAAGGLIGLLIGSALMDDHDGYDDEREEADGVELLVRKIRREAEAAMAECEDDEAREAVYAQIRDAVNGLKDELQEKGEALIAELREQAKEEVAALDTGTEGKVYDHVQNIRDTLSKVSESLDETLDSLRPQPSEAAPAI